MDQWYDSLQGSFIGTHNLMHIFPKISTINFNGTDSLVRLQRITRSQQPSGERVSAWRSCLYQALAASLQSITHTSLKPSPTIKSSYLYIIVYTCTYVGVLVVHVYICTINELVVQFVQLMRHTCVQNKCVHITV